MNQANTQIDFHFDKFTDEALRWLRSIAGKMEMPERLDIAQQALRGVLHALRDRMVPEEVFDLSAQLPVLIRGFYFEGYTLRDKPRKYSADDLLHHIEKSFGGNINVQPESAFGAVMSVLQDHISKGELQHIYDGMPKDIKELWDKSIND